MPPPNMAEGRRYIFFFRVDSGKSFCPLSENVAATDIPVTNIQLPHILHQRQPLFRTIPVYSSAAKSKKPNNYTQTMRKILKKNWGLLPLVMNVALTRCNLQRATLSALRYIAPPLVATSHQIVSPSFSSPGRQQLLTDTFTAWRFFNLRRVYLYVPSKRLVRKSGVLLLRLKLLSLVCGVVILHVMYVTCFEFF